MGTISAHRMYYEYYKGEIPYGMVVHHKCRNKACVNPDHLELMTDRRHKQLHQRKKFCKRGHPMFGENLVVYKDGERGCRACIAIRNSWRTTL